MASTQTWAQLFWNCHTPLVSQLCSVWPAHWVLPGTHTPPHDGLAARQALPHCIGSQVPPGLQVCRIVPEHCLSPVLHALHWPAVHTIGQVDWSIQWPVASQVCTLFKLHWAGAVNGTHSPVHAPLLQTKGQVASVFHWPLAPSHDWATRSTQRASPALHTRGSVRSGG